MVAGPIQAFTREDVKARWTERYTSDAINKKFLGIPRGIYLGFIPSPAGLVLTLKPDKAITFTALTGVFAVNDALTGGSSGATAIVRVVSAGYVLVDTVVGAFTSGETLTGGAGSATVSQFVEEDVSLGRVVSSSAASAGRSEHMLDVITTDPIALDFTGFGDGVYYVILTANYAVGQTTIGSILTRTTPPPSGASEVLVCIATKVGAALTVAATAPVSRHEPHAFEGTRIGFMPGGSIENLTLAVSGTQEVTASRQLSDGTTAPAFNPALPQSAGLPARLNTDLGNVAMGGRLGKRLSAVQGNQFTLAGPVTEANVSGSFSSRNRDFEPFRDLSPSTGILIPPGIQPAIEAAGADTVKLTLTGIVGSFTSGLSITGSTSGATAIIKSVVGTVMTVSDFVGSLFSGEPISQAAPVATATISAIDLSEGAVTAQTGITTENNVCVIIDTATGRRAVDASGNVVFGRLVYGPGGVSQPGEYSLAVGQQLNFTASTTTVVVAAGSILSPSELDVGDLIEGDDGRFYEIASIIGSPITSFNLPVTKDYVGPTAINVGSLRRRRFTLEFKFITSGSESVATLPAGTYGFFFPAWFTLEKSNLSEVMQSNPPGNSLIVDGATTDATKPVASTDNRVGQVYGNASTVVGAANTVRRPRIEIVNGSSISVQLQDNGDRLTFTINNTAPAGGGATPTGPAGGDLSGSSYPNPIVATVGGISAATIGLLPSKDGLRVAYDTTNPLTASFTVPTGFSPRLAIFVTNNPAQGIAVGIATGNTPGDQASVLFAGNAGNTSVFETGNVCGGFFSTRWECQTFNNVSVTINRTGGSDNFPGCIVCVLGDNL